MALRFIGSGEAHGFSLPNRAKSDLRVSELGTLRKNPERRNDSEQRPTLAFKVSGG